MDGYPKTGVTQFKTRSLDLPLEGPCALRALEGHEVLSPGEQESKGQSGSRPGLEVTAPHTDRQRGWGSQFCLIGSCCHDLCRAAACSGVGRSTTPL